MAHNYQHFAQRLIIFSIHEVNFIKSTKGRLWNRNKTGCFSTDHIDGAGYRKSSWSNGELTLLSGRRNFKIETLSYYTYKSRWKNCFSLRPLAKQALFSCWLYVSCQTGNFRLRLMFRVETFDCSDLSLIICKNPILILDLHRSARCGTTGLFGHDFQHSRSWCCWFRHALRFRSFHDESLEKAKKTSKIPFTPRAYVTKGM